MVEPHRREKLVPVMRGVDPHDRLGGRVLVSEARERERDRLAGTGEPREFRVDVGQHGPVARRADMQREVGSVLDVDRLVAGFEGLRSVGRQILLRVGWIDGLDEEVLRVGVRGGDAPGDRLVLPSSTTGRPGTVAPLTEPSGVTIRARYQRIGAPSSRCGSLARIGLPVAVRAPETTHSLEAPC